MQLDYEAIVIGSGFGGAINACRLAKKWPGKVLVLERGKRYPMGSFPRTPHDMSNNFWNVVREKQENPKNTGSKEMFGLFDIRSFEHMDAVVGAGLGGGSLIYANVFLEPPEHIFDHNWPDSCKKDVLQPYYQTAKSVLGARPIPDQSAPRREVVRTQLFEQFAKSDGRESELVDINVFFGNDFNQPTDIGVQEKNRYGAVQTSCVYCAECDVGCNTHSKNTTDLNYLFVAENDYQTKINTMTLVEKIVPLNSAGEEDPTINGEYGYKVIWLDLNNNKHEVSATSKRVIVSAGTLGTNELLLRCREVFKTLPNINQNLGRHFSGNGDFLSFVIDGEKPADPNYGPVITQKIDYNLYQDFKPGEAYILEDASFPNFASWYTEGLKPGVLQISGLIRTLNMLFKRFVRGIKTGRVGYAFRELLKNDAAYTTSVLLCMGIDNSAGKMKLDKHGFLNLEWPFKQNQPLYNAIMDMGKRFTRWANAKAFLPMPNFFWPLKSNVTVHALGGCKLADSPEVGVTSASKETFGQVFNYKGLYVADGSLLPTAVGANPVATISALSERVAEGITGIEPNPNGDL
ncbi:GMC oxidoreductase [uncultured Paraglaciecola sp.]|uniref:GMC family oxidoreductase N-terminal domain-containing protein n=1 Tax=uncultured Paraglaciecola sp. TaxID=1765024 RepID=UPI0025D65516|nr:GMC oxidoreductase [uncultured Paraglaciecola sp.]